MELVNSFGLHAKVEGCGCPEKTCAYVVYVETERLNFNICNQDSIAHMQRIVRSAVVKRKE